MSTKIDGYNLFDRRKLEIEVGSFKRDSIERAVPGLDGVMTIDLGRRGRKIKQTGTLRAKSRDKLNERIFSISDYIDGNTHTLVTDDGREFNNLRMDSFKMANEHADGVNIIVDYEIIYTQLV
jgi:hypothetical protein